MSYLHKILLVRLLTIFYIVPVSIHAAELEFPDYQEPKVIFDFYFDDPQKINAALFWVRSYLNPLTEEPYNMAPEFMNIKVMIHGREIVTVAKKNYSLYKEAIERMKYYAQLGVEFKVCAIAANDFGYNPEDFHDFIKVVPSAITELAHWQSLGYGLITPRILFKMEDNESIR